MRCALVSTSGEMLAHRDGSAIDAHEFVMRLGQAPVDAMYAPHVGTRTSVRYIAGSFFLAIRHMNHSSMHSILDSMLASQSEVVWILVPREVKPWHEQAGCPPLIADFMRQHAGLPYRCVMNSISECPWPSAIRQPSSGAVAISLLFGVYHCQTVQLFGFANTNLSMPYHYWRDGSSHDDATSAQWYASRAHSRTHYFEEEHVIMYNVLGNCSWTLRSDAYWRACENHFKAGTATCPSPAPNNLLHGAKNTAAVTSGTLKAVTAPYLILPQYWTREQAVTARGQVLEAMSRCHDIGEGGDNRTMGISTTTENDASRFDLIQQFRSDAHLHEIAAAHLHMPLHAVHVKTLAGSTAPGQSSGGGWHKDDLRRGFKALIYLDDVIDVAVGPFAMLLNYSDASLKHAPDPRGRKTRFTEQAVQKQVMRGARVQPILGAAGTVVIFETSSVHRGMPALTSGRVALTNYYHNNLATCGVPKMTKSQTL